MNVLTPRDGTRTSVIRRRIATALIAAVIAPLLSVAAAAPAHAETDFLASQCIAVGGITRGCEEGTNVQWGSGLYWYIASTVRRTTTGDKWRTTVEYSLNRKLSSNTPYSTLTAVTNSSAYVVANVGVNTGYDPTYGAWIRLCTTSPAGAKYCLTPRYVTDNS